MGRNASQSCEIRTLCSGSAQLAPQQCFVNARMTNEMPIGHQTSSFLTPTEKQIVSHSQLTDLDGERSKFRTRLGTIARMILSAC